MSRGSTQIEIGIAEFEAACDSYDGVCLECSAITNSGVEPDARCYECECCGEPTVYGMEEALMMGVLTIRFES